MTRAPIVLAALSAVLALGCNQGTHGANLFMVDEVNQGGLGCKTHGASPAPDAAFTTISLDVLAVPDAGTNAVTRCRFPLVPGGIEYQRWERSDAGVQFVCGICPGEWKDSTCVASRTNGCE